MEKITFASADSQENEEFFVLEQTKLNGVSYILVTDSEEDDAECWILKDSHYPIQFFFIFHKLIDCLG